MSLMLTLLGMIECAELGMHFVQSRRKLSDPLLHWKKEVMCVCVAHVTCYVVKKDMTE